jgi:hypothetical protein
MYLRKINRPNNFQTLLNHLLILLILLCPNTNFHSINNSSKLLPDIRIENEKLIVPLPQTVIREYLSRQPRQWLINNDKQQLEFISSHLVKLNPERNSFSFRIELINNLFTRVLKKRIRLSRKKCIVKLESFFNANGDQPLKSVQTSSLHCDKGITGLDLITHSSEVLEKHWMKLFKVNLRHSYLEKYAMNLLNKKLSKIDLPKRLGSVTAKNLPDYLLISGVKVMKEGVEVSLRFDKSKFENLP